jgi:predicted nucleic acid-binding protein
MKSVTLDSHAILRFAQDEEGADRVEELLRASEESRLKAYVNEINLGEVYYITMRRLGLEPARRFLEQFPPWPWKEFPRRGKSSRPPPS